MQKEPVPENSASVKSEDVAALKPGFELGNYKIKKVIGQGGFGITYLAYDEALEVDVVIKENMPAMFAIRDTAGNAVCARTLSRKNGDFDWAMKNFIHEARLLARLNHPNIVRVTRVFNALGTAYYVMPYVEGLSLADYHKQNGVLDEHTLRPILMQLLAALKYLHAQNPMILHRDIKPGNVLLHANGTPVLIDFGMARELMGEKSQTIMESAGFTPIEQMQSHGKIGPWSDIYALGGLMYNMVSGRVPLRSTDRIGEEDSLMKLADDPECLSRCSREFLCCIDKALGVWPMTRWQSAEEWMNALRSSETESNKQTTRIPMQREKQPRSTAWAQDSQPGPEIAQDQPPFALPKRSYIIGYFIIIVVLRALSCIHVSDCTCALCIASSSALSMVFLYGLFELFCGCKEKSQRFICLSISFIVTLLGGAISWWTNLAHTNADDIIGVVLLYLFGCILALTVFLRLNFRLKALRIVLFWVALFSLGALNSGIDYIAQGDKPFIAQTKLVNEGEKRLWGFGCERDPNAAVQLFNQAAEEEDARAICYLAICNMPGFIDEGDENKARTYFQQARVRLKKMADAGDASALRLLGMCYCYGLGRSVDATAAFKCYRKAALKGDAMAQAQLAGLYMEGHSAPKDLNEAFKWYQKSAKQQHQWGERGLGLCYLNGWGVDKDEHEAVIWFTKAAEKGDSAAQYQLASAYYLGVGVGLDAKLALDWFTKAANNGEAEAQSQLGDFCLHGEGGMDQNASAAVSWYQAAAAQGHAPAADMLGECYRNGVGVSPDNEVAVSWYQRAAEAGYSRGQYHLAEAYLDGVGVEKDEDKAVSLLQQAADQGLPEAQYKLGFCCDIGLGGPQDKRKAVELYREAVAQGEPRAKFNMGICYYYGQVVQKNSREAFRLIKESAEAGVPSAQNWMGYFYECGDGVDQDFGKAVDWYRKAAEQGFAAAQHSLGLCYESGQGVAQDMQKAVEWYRKAAEQGSPVGQYRLGVAYLNGIGLVQNEREGFMWMQKSAEQGLSAAQNVLGVCYASGSGVSKDLQKAAEWYQKAAEQGNVWGQYNLGVAYISGGGIAQNEEDGFRWVQKAADQGLPDAQNFLGICYADGKGVTASPQKAVLWFRKAAEQGHAWGQFNLGMAYLNGNGIRKNTKTAETWLRKAAEQGIEDAEKQLYQLRQ